MQRIVAAALTWLLVAPAGVWAQGSPVNRLGSFAITGTPSEAKLREATLREAAWLAPSPATLEQGRPPQKRSWAKRHPVLLGTFVGAGIGTVVGAASPCIIESGATCRGVGAAVGAAVGAGWGAGIGALFGLIASRR